MRTIIKNAGLFDGSGSPVRPATVVVRGERIERIIEAGETIDPDAEDLVIDGTGRTLMPGMVEAHAHLSWPSSVEKIYHEFVLPPEEMKVATWRNARVLLDHGFTSAFSAGALGDTLEVELRGEIEAGITPGPRLRASTIERSPEGADGIETGKKLSIGEGVEGMRAFVRRCAENGIDTVKLVISGEDALLPGSSQHVLYSQEEVTAACEEAHGRGLRVAAHTQAAEAVKIALRAGVDVLYHCSYADDEALDMLEAARDRIFMGPAIGIIVATLEASPPPHIDMTSMKESAKPVIKNTAVLIPELKRRGVRVLPGGDYGFPFNPNGRNARDLEHFVTLYGYTQAEALVAATMLGGEIMGMGDELGQVRPGYLADLLLVDGDPTQDVRILQDKDRLTVIMKNGHLHKAPGGTAAAKAA
ncbi:amidohydrolase family protein [Sphingosinicella sp. BN140058]|uniref:metal-dependent hydrolase family protein n=1 Tax=Sphingosinicella sp. BN140058 TaxID=1892855 RepID=UPI0010139EB3|nr:amidohydrolase family protein [Sphingosinicella sp. BN140058]QAY78106.1 amidohydrolase family protein [Sphingosinicella sp. BN140058]